MVFQDFEKPIPVKFNHWRLRVVRSTVFDSGRQWSTVVDRRQLSTASTVVDSSRQFDSSVDSFDSFDSQGSDPPRVRVKIAEGSCGHLPFKRLIDGAVFTHHRRTEIHFFACGAGRGAFIGSAP